MGDDNRSALPPGDEAHNEDSRPVKRQRNFIARQACEACRSKKTRCDEDMPCSLCKSLGIECIYAERKPTKNEISMGMIFNTLRRMESKIDHLSVPVSAKSAHEHETNRTDSNVSHAESPYHMDSVISHQSFSSPLSSTRQLLRHSTTQSGILSFSARRTIHWPGVEALLPSSLNSAVRNLEKSYPTHLESGRPSLEPVISAQGAMPTLDWLASLSLSSVKDLSNAYFDTFNRVYPCIDRDFYFLSTLAVVVREGFGHDIESCLVLNVMALGCMGFKAYEEGGFEIASQASITPIIRHIMEEEIAGLSFFNEARRRAGLCLCERDIQACQYYLTSAVFFAQVMRPVDKWLETGRAAVICTAFWKCPPEPVDEWLADMHARLFWCSLVLESLVVQELELPPSGLKVWEDEVPLPKFTTYPYASSSRPQHSDDSLYHYHFLAQIAHRIILNRIKDELFFSNPSTKVAEELRHQLEQWRANLPQALRYASDQEQQNFDCPADAVVIALLQMRYRVSIFHLGRPFLYKAIQNPASVNETELKLCAQALEYAMDWHMTLDVCARMQNFEPLKYFACGQFFGQLLIFHAFKNSPDRRLRDTLPSGFEAWCTRMLRFIYDFVDSSPTIAKDFELLSSLYHVPDG
ncbi:uncharacterized protein Z519_09135 [Cladophialophora bantiana CBS 173.52]|uniref:Zn(2)-C6 fungal-type domain-containing protein n=1 Tax=Cladophialophora bantiana (strain ATCC 10958 / CBS 173.52 / CDC B-1940 / NIH 8579) TaxID=1442370 RepID=A0A0D2I0Y5_CLAB1|nr:uncharacterized protein Z519_09135 [Cladophialophora bantiana CBS 173.52]KIW90489.1 hypothetical protein Z519_09135 [Cladophialophora bantiana CBS 173.52]